MNEGPEPAPPDGAPSGAGPSDAGVDPMMRPEVAGDPEVAAMVRALREDDDGADPSDVRADVSEASENIGTGSDR